MQKKRIIVLMLIVVTAAVLVQVFRVGEVTAVFRANQVEYEAEFTYVSARIPETYTRILVVSSEMDEDSRRLQEQIYHTFNMAKLNYWFALVEADDIEGEIKKLNPGDVLIIGTEKIDELENYQGIIDFVEDGGKAVFLIRSAFEPLDEMVGIINNRGFFDSSIFGLKFEEKMFPGLDGIERATFENSMLDVDLDNDVKILATASDKPLIWTHEYGKGEILYVNSTILGSKTSRGLLLQCVAYLPDHFLTTIFNGLVFNIDDFPAPIQLGKHENIYNDYFMKTPVFFREIWWPDTYDFAQRHDIKLTGLAIMTFNTDTTSPLEPVNDTEFQHLKYFGRRLAEAQGEIGIHGYNHQSLALAGQMNFERYGYVPWETQITMREGLRILKTTMEEIFGEIKFFTYVPPSNIISKEGRLAVKHVFDDVKVFAGIYTGRVGEPGLLIQEFGRDPYVPEVVSFPRLSSGYLYNEESMWEIYDGIAHYGLVNHFIHPDDLLCETRSGGLSWEALDREINTMFGEVRANFPFLRPLTNVEAYVEFLKLENLKVYSRIDNGVLHVSYDRGVVPVYHFLRLRDQKVVEVEGGAFTLICRDSGLYLVEGHNSTVKIILGG